MNSSDNPNNQALTRVLDAVGELPKLASLTLGTLSAGDVVRFDTVSGSTYVFEYENSAGQVSTGRMTRINLEDPDDVNGVDARVYTESLALGDTMTFSYHPNPARPDRVRHLYTTEIENIEVAKGTPET